MTELSERLRVLAREYWQHRPHYEEAAAEIERLTANRAQLVLMTEVQRASNREIERLQATTVPASLHLYEITKLELEIERLQALIAKLRTRVELADK